METRDRLHGIDEVRLHEIILIFDHVRGDYIPEIKECLNKIEEALSDLISKYGSEDE